MSKNTGITAKDVKDGKAASLPVSKAKKVNEKLKNEEDLPAPTKTVELVKDARETKKNK